MPGILDTPNPLNTLDPPGNTDFLDLLGKYLPDGRTGHIVLVQCTGGSKAEILFFEKTGTPNCRAWSLLLQCGGIIGKNGCAADSISPTYQTSPAPGNRHAPFPRTAPALERKKEGDGKTPCGDFGAVGAFGIKDNPGAQIDYHHITEDDYWCDKRGMFYNRLISAKNVPNASGEHLIDCSPEYNYGLFLDYNRACLWDAGSAIFFHCTGKKDYTGGCVAVAEEHMIYILRKFEKNDRIIIVPNSLNI